MKQKIPDRPVYFALFFLLAFLCYQAHQLVRLLVGSALCGGFGSMTFTVTTTREPCIFPTLVTISGPLLTYGLAWLGMFLLRSPKFGLFAYFLIFASFAPPRFIQTLTGRGDELILAQQWFHISSQPVVALADFLISLPPVIAAFRSIGNKPRLLVFIVSWLLPLPVLFVLLFGDKFLFQSSVIGMQFGSILGIWLIVLVIDIIAVALMLIFGPRYLRTESAS